MYYIIHDVFILQSKIDRLQGANVESLEAKIQQHIGAAADGDDSAEDFGQGLVCTNEALRVETIH